MALFCCVEQNDQCLPGACCFPFGAVFTDVFADDAVFEEIFIGYVFGRDGDPEDGVCFDEVAGNDCIAIGGEYLGAGLTCNGDPDSDGAYGCDDGCPLDPDKIEPGICGCGTSDDDSDGDDVPDCIDLCPEEPGTIDGCPAIGACCFHVDVCVDNTDPKDCAWVGGMYQGVWSSCEDGCVFPGDVDGDGDIDLFDGSEFVECMTGPGGALAEGCELADTDNDNDVDLGNFAILQNAFTGDLAE